MEMGAQLAGKNRNWRPQLTRWEKRVGWAFFALYIFVFPFLVGGVVRILDEHLELALTPAQSNAVYYTVILLLLIAVFWDFLRHAGTILLENLRSSFFVFGMGLLAGLVGTCLAGAIPLPMPNPVLADYKEQYALSGGAVFAIVVLLRPAVEEILFRGLLFGSLRKKSRALAYGVSAGLFALVSVWQYALVPEVGGALHLLRFIQYLPLGLVECWVYDVSGSVYTPMVLRMALQAAFLLFALVA